MKLLTLFFSFLQIGAFSFGGGYAALPLIQHQVVDLYHWLTMNELTDLITISQMTPGPIAINAATFVGLKIDSLWGYSSDIGMHFTFMYYCIADCLYLFKISANVNYSKYFKIYSSGCSVADCSFRTIDYC